MQPFAKSSGCNQFVWRTSAYRIFKIDCFMACRFKLFAYTDGHTFI